MNTIQRVSICMLHICKFLLMLIPIGIALYWLLIDTMAIKYIQKFSEITVFIPEVGYIELEKAFFNSV